MTSITAKSSPPISRREVRERAMQALYAWEISREPIEMVVKNIAGSGLLNEPELFSFAENLVYTVLQHRTELDQAISIHATNWDFGRLALLDRIILRLGIAEFLYFPEIPPKVTINECVEIAKRYSTENSGKFINGMLDTMQHELQKSGRIQKTGRGLIDH